MVMSRSTTNRRHGYNGDHGTTTKRYEVNIPGFQRTEQVELIPQPPMRLSNGMTIPRSPHRRIVVTYKAAIWEYEFEIRYKNGHYIATSPQRPDWTYRFSLITPVSQYWSTLETASLMWEIDADAKDGFDDWFLDGLPETSGDGLGEDDKGGLVTGVDY